MPNRMARSDGALPGDVPDEARAVLEDFLAKGVDALEGAVEGVVLFGSLVAGGFEPGSSDLDLIVAVSTDVDEAALEALRRMHAELVRAHPEWEDRIDVAYLSVLALQTFKQRDSPLVVISRSEPIHRTRTDPGWIMNWHLAREVGVALLGPSPRDLIAKTSEADFVAAVRTHMRWMLAKLESSDAPELRAHAIVTACRALHTCRGGAQLSKQAAALWAEARYPEWSVPIRSAREWRRGAAARDPIPQGLEFVRFAVQEIFLSRLRSI